MPPPPYPPFPLLLSWCFGVTKVVIQPEACGGAKEPDHVDPCRPCACVRALEALRARPHWKTCRLVVTWQHCWHEKNDVEELKLCMDYGQKCMWISQHCTTAQKKKKKKDTGESPRYSYKLFCICCSIYQK